MIIWKGKGLLAPVIFVGVYLIIYGLCHQITSPHLLHGWFPYLGTLLAALATWRAGLQINREVYKNRREFPLKKNPAHSFFFIPIEYSAIPLAVLFLFGGFVNTKKVQKRKAEDLVKEEVAQDKFLEKVKKFDELIINPQKGDYYLMSFFGTIEQPNRASLTEHKFFLPLKVIDFDEDRIELFCPLTYTYETDIKIYNRNQFYKIYYDSEEDGYAAWVTKNALRRAINRDYNSNLPPAVAMPALIGEDPISVLDIWRVGGPQIHRENGNWLSAADLDLALINKGFPLTYQEIRYQGNKVNFSNNWARKESNRTNRNNPNYKAVAKGARINHDQTFYIVGHSDNKNEDVPIELFCNDLSGRKFRIDITRGQGDEIVIEYVQLSD